jgi:hypothetical protein
VTDKAPDSRLKTDDEAMDRLRDRTDELELIISSLTILALFSLPSWLFSRYADIYTHLSTSLVIGSTAVLTLLTGTCYGLGGCFVVHLMARAYWVGLIGLRTVFPAGINWSKTPGLGPVSRQHYKSNLPDLDSVIQKTDRVASSLFAVISMLTLSLLWFGAILVSITVVSGAIGARFGQTNAGTAIGALVIITVFVGMPILLYLLDAQLATRFPALLDSKIFVGIVRFLRRIAGMAYPQRLVLPVQLTLQSNTRPVAFFIALFASIFFIILIGNVRVTAWQFFTLSGQFTYLNADQVQQGLRSAYYEDMPSPADRIRAWPRVDSFHQNGGFARLFLPYQPLRDNLVLEQNCGDPEEAENTVDCLRQLWTVSIDGKAVSTSTFVTAERADIRMRGLIGLVPLAGLEPGLHEIVVVWNAGAAEDEQPLDDRYTQVNFTYTIPIAFSPSFEMPL